MLNLADEIKAKLPPELNRLLKSASETANSLGAKIYLVGGTVRDLLLGQANLDIDLAVDGNAVAVAQKLTDTHPGKITTHPRFGTATIHWDEWRIDLATTRSETYPKPGALPLVSSGTISSDLHRRDFTINAMAIDLNPQNYGEMIDPHEGMADLKSRLIRILHNQSFTDDATRILRGLRYAQRLNFQIEPGTLCLLKRDTPGLDTISGDRIRHELDLILQEKQPERVLRLAGQLKVLAHLHPALKGNGWLQDHFEQARQLPSPHTPATGLYLALLTYRLSCEEIEQLIARLRLPKATSQTLRNTVSLKESLKALADPELTPSHIYRHLQGYSPTAITAALIASDLPVTKEHLQLYLKKIRYVKPALSGYDLIDMGVPPGPYVKEILSKLQDARLDGQVKNKEEAVEMVRGWLTNIL